MPVKIQFDDLTADHIRQYDRIVTIAGYAKTEESRIAWDKPKLAPFVARCAESPVKTLAVRVDVLNDEAVRQLCERANYQLSNLI